MEPPLFSAPLPIGPRSAPLINLREFRIIAKELLQEDGLSPALDVPVDISTDEVQRVTPFERIEDAIQAALVRLGDGQSHSLAERHGGSRRCERCTASMSRHRDANVFVAVSDA
jgi:hypothetical protein